MIRVLLVDDHGLMRQGLRVLLMAESDIEIIGEADDGRDAIQNVERLQPDIVIMDISMAGLNGLEATRIIRSKAPNTRVVILSMHTNEEYVMRALGSGADAYVLKQGLKDELLLAIRAAYAGKQFLSTQVARTVRQSTFTGSESTEKSKSELLTTREREVLQLIGEGLSNPEIASRLVISPKTVERHKANIMEKVRIHSTPGLVRLAIEWGLVQIDPPNG